MNCYTFSKILYVLYILRYKKFQKLSPTFIFLQKESIDSIAKLNSSRSTLKTEVTSANLLIMGQNNFFN